MQVKDFTELNTIDQQIMSMHEELTELYGKRASLLTGDKKPPKRTKKASIKDIDLNTIDLSLD